MSNNLKFKLSIVKCEVPYNSIFSISLLIKVDQNYYQPILKIANTFSIKYYTFRSSTLVNIK